MVDFVFSKLQFITNYVSFPVVLAFVFLIGLYLFWRNSRMTKKNRNSVFDMFFITAISMIVWGRITYIILNVNDYINLPWSISPYERYSDGLFFFRLLPWKYFALWDGGVLYIPMFVIFAIVATLYALIIKRWRIREILGTIVISSTFSLATTFLATGLYSNEITIFSQGFYIVIFIMFYQTLLAFLSFLWRNTVDTFFKTYFIMSIVAHILIAFYVSISLLSSPITSIDKLHMYIFILWSIVVAILFVIDMNKSTHVKEIHIKSKKITPNVPVRLHNN